MCPVGWAHIVKEVFRNEGKVLFTINKKKEPNKVRKQATLYFEIGRKVSKLRYYSSLFYKTKVLSP